MIDEKKLIEILSKNSIFEKITNAEGKNIFEIIDEQPKKDCSECTRRKFYQQGYQDGLNADKWIPVEERLPSVGDAVLVVDEYALYDVCTVIERYGEMMLENSSGCWLDIENYIAWQPLPAPYKKEGAENE